MVFYHLDRLNRFPSDPHCQLIPINTSNTQDADEMACSLYPNGISKTGFRYLSPFNVNLETGDAAKETWENARIYAVEYAFEMARLHYFKNLPSRFESLFACKTPEDICFWYNILSDNKTDCSAATVKIIETNKDVFVGDAGWRDMPLRLNGRAVFSPFAYYVWAYKYWSGESAGPQPKSEVLCRLPVSVKDSIPLADFLRGI